MFTLEFLGRLPYQDQWGQLHRGQKVVVPARAPLRAGGSLDLEFVLDTGSPWTIVDPSFLPNLAADALGEKQRVLLCGDEIVGQLFRVPLSFGEMDQEFLAIEATILFPILAPDQTWPHPNFLGLSALDRLRWALEPDTNQFYYAPVG